MNVLSLFDGISCGRVALERAGIKIDHYFASEIDKYAIKIAKKNYPDTNHIGDVRQIRVWGGIEYESGVLSTTIDLLMGGSPCQDLSIAKKGGKGLEGEKSGLFYEYVRILHEVKPRYFLLENVASMKKADRDKITEILGVEPVMINSALFSAQNRKRLYWVGKWNGESYDTVVIPQPEDKGILLKDILESDVDEAYCIKSNTITASYNRGAYEGNIGTHREHTMVRVGHFNSGGQGDRVYSDEGKSVSLSANGGGRGAKTGLYAVGVALRNRGEGKQPEYNGQEKANSMTTVQTDSMVDVWHIRKLTPIECERLQTLPDNYTEGISNTQRYKAIGNGWTVDVISHIFTHLIGK